MFRLKMTLAYTGTQFSGWQVQPGQRTVQGCLEEGLRRICAVPVRVHAAGRTDAGVHALGQVVHCDLPDNRLGVPWQRALNSLLPEDMAVTGVQPVDREFHARRSARCKTYTYTLWQKTAYVLPQRRPFVWKTGCLDQAAMLQAAAVVQGKHDFSAFQNVGTPVASSVRHLAAVWFAQGLCESELVCHFQGEGFLKQMVRNLVAAIVAVGQGRLGLEELQALLQGRDRTRGPATAPAQGLCLTRVDYPEPGGV